MTHPQLSLNQTSCEFADQLTVADLFATRVAEHPHRTAIRDSSGVELSYAEVDRFTAATAMALQQAHLRPGGRVAMITGRTITGCTLGMASIRAGGQFVPLDPSWPPARLVALIDQLDIRHVVCDNTAVPVANQIRWLTHKPLTVVCADDPPPVDLDQMDTITELFDQLAESDDPLIANGFQVRGDETFTFDDLALYHSHLRDLMVQAGADGTVRIADIGCGVGDASAAIADLTSAILCVDPSYESIRRAAAAIKDAHPAVAVDLEVVDALTLDRTLLHDRDVILMASVVQFLGGHEEFLRAVTHIVNGAPNGARLILADLIPPEHESPGLLTIPPDLIRHLPRLVAGIQSADVLTRRTTDENLARRYDAIILIEHVGPPGELEQLVIRPGSGGFEGSPDGPRASPGPADLAYAIFTSGTTGVPKAAQINHRALTNLVEWMGTAQNIDGSDSLLFTTSFCFDLSIFDTLGMLALGGTIRVASQDELDDPRRLIDALRAEPITTWDSAPAALQMLLPLLEIEPGVISTHLIRVMLSGDWVPVHISEQIQPAFPAASVVSLGGATETTVWANSYRIDDVDPAWPSVPYGTPMQNAEDYVLTDTLEFCDLDEEGDLYTAGLCLASGYAEALQTTAAKFIPNPYGPPGSVMYATGDRVRWQSDGLMQFRGRQDDQVKVQGHRIELGEIQAAATRIMGVCDAAALTYPRADGHGLALFCVVTTPTRADDILSALRQVLPRYMVPDVIDVIPTLPVTPNGKVDRAQLRAHLPT